MFIQPEHLEQIKRWGQEALPSEACGILVDDYPTQFIRKLKNTAEDPTRSYLIDNDELVQCLVDLTVDEGTRVKKHQVTVWHTHPSGHIGPSYEDLETKVPELGYLVVALPNGEATVF